jgi:hypothetical protein
MRSEKTGLRIQKGEGMKERSKVKGVEDRALGLGVRD